MSKAQLKQSEKAYEAAVVEYSKLNGWLSFHAFDSRRSEPGFPDRVFVRPPRIVIVEFKSETGRLSKAQKVWLEALRACADDLFAVSDEGGFEVHEWRPRDWWHVEEVLGR